MMLMTHRAYLAILNPPSSGLSATFSPDFGGEGTEIATSKGAGQGKRTSQRFEVAACAPGKTLVENPDGGAILYESSSR